ncbi:MAG: heparinase II/III family protein [Bacteroidales bacterium]|nr:heparinase II/III family protein [Bacteroidales bacterium]
MLKRILLTVLMTVAAVLNISAAKVPDYNRLKASRHPRITLTDNDVRVIKKKLKSGEDPVLSKLHEIIVKAADKYLDAAPLEHKLIGPRLLDTSHAANQQIVTLAYAWRLTGDRRYGEKAVSVMETVCAFPDWNPSHFLDVGEMAHGVGTGYDWLYPILTREQRKRFAEALDMHAFKPALQKEKGYSWFYESASNWNQVCNGGLVVAALACYENCPSDARAIIENAAESNYRMAERLYNPDGNYPEGYAYCIWGSNYESMMLSAMESCLGHDFGINGIPGWKKSPQWLQFMECLNWRCFNYSDCGPSSLAMPMMWYHAFKSGDQSLLFMEIKKLERGMYTDTGIDKYLPFIVTFASRFNLGATPPPSAHLWVGEGINPVALVHGDWSFGESDVMMGLKGGRCNFSHAHMDSGSFVFDADGVNWSVDPGLQDYNSQARAIQKAGRTAGDPYGQDSMRWEFLRNGNFGHSTLSINGALHRSGAFAPITDSFDTPERRGATVNLSETLSDECASAIRTVSVENGRDLAVTDVIQAREDRGALVRWTMITTARPSLEDGCIVLRAKGKTRRLRSTGAGCINLTYTVWDLSGSEIDTPVRGYYRCGFEALVPRGKKCTFTTTLTKE